MRGALDLHQFRGLVDDASGFGFNRFKQLGQFGQLAGAVGDAHAVDPEPGIAFPHALEDPAKQVHVAAESVGGGGGAQAALGQHAPEVAFDPLYQLELVGGQIDLPRIDAAVGHALGDLIGQGAHLSQGAFQQRLEIADRDHRFASGQNDVAFVLDRTPAVTQILQKRLELGRRRRQAQCFTAAFLIVEYLFEAVPALLELGERGLLAASGPQGFRDDRA